MPKKEGDDYVISETGNWNVADKYSKHKIMKPLILSDYYEDIAYFGHEALDEELVNYNLPPNDLIKYKALKRLIKILIRIIDNSKFACKKKGTKEELIEYKSILKSIELNLVTKLFGIKKENGKNVIFIKDSILYEKVLESIGKIKSKINEPLNRNHLIFTDKEEFDPIAFKDRMKERMSNKG